MIMTRETDYAVRILRALSCGERMTVRQVCDLELVPVQFAYKILKKLAACGYVEVFRGQEGGCRLKADLNELSLYDLMRCTNDDIFVNAYMDPGYKCPWRRSHCGVCHFHSSLKGVQNEIEELLKRRYIGKML